MTSADAFSIMQLLVYLVPFLGALLLAESHYILQQGISLPIHSIQYVNPAALVPTHYYTVNHGIGLPGRGRGAVSRETLEEHSGEGIQQELLPDISDEQAHLDPDDNQIPSKPSFPALPPRGFAPPISPPRSPPISPPRVPSIPAGDPGIVFNGPNPDGSYDFSFSQDDQKRSEKGDNQGNVQGTYSYVGPDGKEVKITYTAGAGKGYIPEGEGLLPPPPPSNGDHDSGSGDGDQGQLPVPSGQQPIAPDDDGQQQIPVPVPSGDEGNHKGMPYDYNYEAHASGKNEVADDNGHVKGSYWYIDGAGDNRTVTYTVNGDEGFIANEQVSSGSGTQGSGRPPLPAVGGRQGAPARPSTTGGSRGPTRPPVKGGGSGTKRPGGDIPPVPHTPTKGANPPTNGVPAAGYTPGRKGSQGRGCNHGGSSSGGSGGSGWDKYPLGPSGTKH